MRRRVPLAVRPPFAGAALLGFLLRHAVAEVETGGAGTADGPAALTYARTVRLPHGPGAVRLTWSGAELTAEVDADPHDHDAALAQVAHLVDADLDPGAVDGHLGEDPVLQPLVAATPGLRVPGVVDAEETLFRTLIGQQISLASARACGATITARHGEVLPDPEPGLGRLFPSAAVLAAVDPATLPMPRARGRALVGLAGRLVDGRLDLGADRDPVETRAALLACPGIGPWTADYVLMRARHQPDVLLASDLVIRRELVALRVADPERWAPWRSYATMHLWHAFLERSGPVG